MYCERNYSARIMLHCFFKGGTSYSAVPDPNSVLARTDDALSGKPLLKPRPLIWPLSKRFLRWTGCWGQSSSAAIDDSDESQCQSRDNGDVNSEPLTQCCHSRWLCGKSERPTTMMLERFSTWAFIDVYSSQITLGTCHHHYHYDSYWDSAVFFPRSKALLRSERDQSIHPALAGNPIHINTSSILVSHCCDC